MIDDFLVIKAMEWAFFCKYWHILLPLTAIPIIIVLLGWKYGER